jgi:hypothetical protein
MIGAPCRGTAFLYSGRPDPEWTITATQLLRLTKLWKQLPAGGIPPPKAPPLGYRGCAVRCESGEEWFAYQGVASLLRRAHPPEYRVDDKRHFEREVLETAPPGALPEPLLDFAGV